MLLTLQRQQKLETALREFKLSREAAKQRQEQYAREQKERNMRLHNHIIAAEQTLIQDLENAMNPRNVCLLSVMCI